MLLRFVVTHNYLNEMGNKSDELKRWKKSVRECESKKPLSHRKNRVGRSDGKNG